MSGCSATIASMVDSSAASSCAACACGRYSGLQLLPLAPPMARSSSRGAAASPTRDRRRRGAGCLLGGRRHDLALAGVDGQWRVDEPQPKCIGTGKERRRLVGVALRIAVVGRIGRRQVGDREALAVGRPGGRAAVTRHQHGRLEGARPRRGTRRRAEAPVRRGGTSTSGTPIPRRRRRPRARRRTRAASRPATTPGILRRRGRARAANASRDRAGRAPGPPPRGRGRRRRFRDPRRRRRACRRAIRAPAARRLQPCRRRAASARRPRRRRRRAAIGRPIAVREHDAAVRGPATASAHRRPGVVRWRAIAAATRHDDEVEALTRYRRQRRSTGRRSTMPDRVRWPASPA